MDAAVAGPASGLPLAGAVLCCTSIAPEQRTKLAGIGSQMGATVKLDLTSDVTHLIVGSIDSAKYRYVAKAREDVKVLPPAWLDAMRDQWMTGEDNMDVAALEIKYRLPAFFGLKICLTGFDNPDQRRHIQETAHANGAEYHGDLTKAVTHLIAATPTGKKYEHAFNWGIKIVSLEWFERSLERGMTLLESLFDPRIPVDERGKDAWERRQSSPPTLTKRARDEEQGLAATLHRRKLRRSASTKMGSQSEALWANITAPVPNRPGRVDDDWTEENAAITNHAGRMDAFNSKKQVEKAASTVSRPDDALSGQLRTSVVADAKQSIFKGHLVAIHGFDSDKTTILQQHLECHGAHIAQVENVSNLSDDELRRTFMVVPHDVELDLSFLSGHVRTRFHLVTNWWVERCLYGKRLVDPVSDPLCQPLGGIHVSGFAELTINSTGFSGIELLHITKLISLMGGTYDEQLTPKTLLIICSSHTPNQAKIKFATDRRIAVVHVDWLFACIRTRSLSPIGDFQLNKLVQDTTLGVRPKSQVQQAGNKLTVPRKDDHKPRQSMKRRLDNGGKIALQRSHTLDLAPSAGSAPTSPTMPRPQTNPDPDNLGEKHEEPAAGGLDGHDSLPLQDVDPNSPRRQLTSHTAADLPTVENTKRDRSSSAESLIRPIPAIVRSKAANQNTDTPVSAPPDPNTTALSHSTTLSHPAKDAEDEKDYSDLLAQLRANRKAAPSPAEQSDGKRRRGRRQLGRATSTRSNQSTAESSCNLALENDDDDEHPTIIPEYQPSQELGWDSPGAAKAREQMIKRLGGKISENSVPVQGIGVVKDAVSETTGRSGRRRRG